MDCPHFSAKRCTSCQWLAQPYSVQLNAKQQHLQQLLAPFMPQQVFSPVASEEQGFRYKAKMVICGTAAQPVLGIVNSQGHEIDLADCPLYPSAFQPLFELCREFICRANLTPYDVKTRKGELKFILLSQSRHYGHFMLRLVLRSRNCEASIRKHLPWLLLQNPALTVCTINLQPQPAALLEGPEEIVLTAVAELPEKLNQVPLYLQPQSFFQTNPAMAAALYQTAADWVQQLEGQKEEIVRIWDLFCGVGGFGLHLMNSERELTGIEIAPAAIASARRSAAEMGFSRVQFQALDSAAFASAARQAPDLLMVNPPRRGLGKALCADILRLAPRWLCYSSCNAETLAADLAQLKGYQLIKVQLFDMFAHSSHYEVLTLLQLQQT